jgi:hypothetical protein
MLLAVLAVICREKHPSALALIHFMRFTGIIKHPPDKQS